MNESFGGMLKFNMEVQNERLEGFDVVSTIPYITTRKCRWKDLGSHACNIYDVFLTCVYIISLMLKQK